MTATAPMPPCGVLSPTGEPCTILEWLHAHEYGPRHSWEQCTSRLVWGWARKSCVLEPHGEDVRHETWWTGP